VHAANTSTAFLPGPPELRAGPVAAQPNAAASVALATGGIAAASNLPAAPLASPRVEASLADAIRALEEATRDGGDPGRLTDLHWKLRALYMLSGQRDKALTPIPGLEPREQEFLSNELYALSLYFDTRRNPDRSRRMAEAVPPHTEAAIKLGEQAPLRILNLAFCTQVVSYGVYTPFAKDVFKPGQQVLLYAEIENFISERTPRGHHTRLAASYQIFDSRGDRRAEHQFAPTEEHCHNRRRDYFLRYFLEIPQLPDGRYTLKLSIEDLLGQKVGESSLEFDVQTGTAR
jgi:hypothetical protein